MFALLKSLFGTKSSNRDLSEIWQGELEITIENVGTRKWTFDRDTLALHVGVVQTTFDCPCSYCPDSHESPWEIVSFDRTAKKLVVRRVDIE